MGLMEKAAPLMVERYIERIVERTLERQDEDGGWRHMLVPGNCDPPRHRGNAGFMVGILLDGLAICHQATGDPKVAMAIVRGAEFLIDDMWVVGVQGFRYTSSGPGGIRQLNGIAHAWRISSKPRFEHVLRRGVPPSGSAVDGSGKGIASAFRIAPNVLGVEESIRRA